MCGFIESLENSCNREKSPVLKSQELCSKEINSIVGFLPELVQSLMKIYEASRSPQFLFGSLSFYRTKKWGHLLKEAA